MNLTETISQALREDTHAQRELEMWCKNSSSLHNQFQSIVLNIKRRIKSGTYDPNLAPKLWSYWVDAGAKEYVKQHGSPGARIDTMFQKADRDAVAKKLAVEEFEAIKNGEYD
jgi:hypothetical protein